jgi:outer membrane protein
MNRYPGRYTLVLALLPLFAAPAHAGDIGRSLRAGETSIDEEDNYLELGVSVIAADGLRFKGDLRSDARITPAINARYQWHGVFAEVFAEARAGWSLGYNAYSDEDLSVDFTVGSRYADIGPGISDELGGIETRDRDLSAGVRVSGYVSDYLWQLQAWGDVSDVHGGVGASALIGRHWQVRNWNLHALVGAGYRSAATLDYYYGVTPQEAAASHGYLTAYDAQGGLSYSAEVGATYPLSESWVVRTTARYGHTTGEVAQSPLFECAKRNSAALIFNVSYVF